MKRKDIHHIGSLMTYTDKKDKLEHYLNYMIVMEGSVFEPNFGKLDVSPEEAEIHNKCLDKALIEGLDKNCKVGMSGQMYLVDGKVQTFMGTLVSEEVTFGKVHKVVVDGQPCLQYKVTFRRNGMWFEGDYTDDGQDFVFTRIEPPKEEKTEKKPPLSLVDAMMVLTEGPDNEEEYAKAMQKVINDGSGWSMEGSFGRSMMDAIESGMCMLGRHGCHDYYRNYIPSRSEVQEGTKGSIGYVVNVKGEDWAKMLEEVE